MIADSIPDHIGNDRVHTGQGGGKKGKKGICVNKGVALSLACFEETTGKTVDRAPNRAFLVWEITQASYPDDIIFSNFHKQPQSDNIGKIFRTFLSFVLSV